MLETIAVEAAMLAGREAVQRILGLEDDSTRLVRAVGSSVERLREGPYHAGRDFLLAAARADADGQCREMELRRARERFFDARGGLKGEPVMQSLASLHIALIEHVRARPGEARYWAATALDDALRARDARAAQVPEAGEPPAPAALAVLPPVAVMAGVTYVGARAVQARRRRRAAGSAGDVAQLTAYVEALRELRARLDGRGGTVG